MPLIVNVLNWLLFAWVTKSGFSVISLLLSAKLPKVVLAGIVQFALSKLTVVLSVPLIWCAKWLFAKLNWAESDNVTFPINRALFTVAFAWLTRFNEPVWVALWLNVNWLFCAKLTLPIKSTKPDATALAEFIRCTLPLTFVLGNESIVFCFVRFSDLHSVKPVQSERIHTKFSWFGVTPKVALALLLNCQLPLIAETLRETTACPFWIWKFSAVKVRLIQSSSMITSPRVEPSILAWFWFKWL